MAPDLPSWAYTAASVGAVVWSAALYVGKKLESLDVLVQAKLPDRVTHLEAWRDAEKDHRK